MTNREDEGDSSCETRFAALLAVHLVSQVLDEAYVIVNAATETGQPWRYLALLKNVRSGKLDNDGAEDMTTDCACIGDSSEVYKTNETTVAANLVATSTPQKVSDEALKVINDTSFIGQGDEELSSLDMRQNELNTSTSMFINHLFDMSEVEHVIICNDTEVIPSSPEPDELLTEAMTKIMDSYINTALGIAFGQNVVYTDVECTESQSQTEEKSLSPKYSGYSFLADAFTAETDNIMEDIAFCVEKEIIYCDKDVAGSSGIVTEITEQSKEVVEQEEDKEIETEEDQETEPNKSDVTRYENAYLTLNRDYDQCSDDDGDPILQDPKGMLMQEVELLSMQTSDENSVGNEVIERKSKDLTATSAVSASSRKSSLVQRCRTQGSRLLACLRGWWRRKTPGKRKEGRIPGSARGLCPLSPDARRRAASLLDQRRGSPDPSQHVVWKFNTVSEALVNSARWKNFTFDVNADGY